MKKGLVWFLIFTFGLMPAFGHTQSLGASLSSDNFRVIDSQQTIFGGTSSISSQNFTLTAVIGGFAIGSSSFTSFNLRSGFLYYPKVTTPTLNTATAGSGQVALSWTAASAFQGWSIGGYNVCHKSTGSYTCVDTSSTSTSYTKTGLTNGTTYTFKIQAYDGLAAKNVIAESNELTGIPAASATPTPTPSSGGGGGGGGGGQPGYTVSTGSITVKGIAYTQSAVVVLIDGVQVATLIADKLANFEGTLRDIPSGQKSVGLYSIDSNGRKSITITFNINLPPNATTTLEGILMPTTIDISTTQVNKGENVRIFGQAAPFSNVNIHVQSEETITKTTADSLGAYAIVFNTSKLEESEHITKSRALISDLVSPFSRVLQFFVGRQGKRIKTADLNKDGRVNIIDFSILLYWWDTKQAKGLEIADINEDNKVNVIDFSIMLFQWTG